MERLAKRRQEASLDSEPTLRDFIQGFSQIPLKPAELRAIRAADSLQIGLLDKKTLFLAFIFLNDTRGIFRAKDVMGVSFEQAVSARDRVRTNKHYEELWEEFDFIRGFNFESGEGVRRLEEKHPQAVLVLALKHQGLTNSRISKMIKEAPKSVDKITRAFVFLEIIPPHKSRVVDVERQNTFMRKIIRLRNQRLGNYKIADKLGVPLDRVEEATRFLVWVGFLDPISKTDALLQRYNKKDHKEEVRNLINSLDCSLESPLISIIELYTSSNLEIGLDKFMRLFHEIEKEPGQKIPRYYHRKKRSKLQ